MSDILVIKQVPEDVKAFWSAQAKSNARSMNKELLLVLMREKERRERVESPKKQMSDIMRTLEEFRKLPVLNPNANDKMLYDDQGLAG